MIGSLGIVVSLNSHASCEHQELKTLAKSCGLAESDVHQGLKRMAHSVDAAAKAPLDALSSTTMVLAAKKTGVAGLDWPY